MMPAHCSELMAPVPESVSRSMSTSSDASRKGLYPDAIRCACRWLRVVMRSGSTDLILNGSMIVWNVGGGPDRESGWATVIRQLPPLRRSPQGR